MGKSLLGVFLPLVVMACGAKTEPEAKELSSEPKPSEEKIKLVKKTDEEWKKILI